MRRACPGSARRSAGRRARCAPAAPPSRQAASPRVHAAVEVSASLRRERPARRAGGPAWPRLRPRRSRRSTRFGMTPASKPRSRKVCTACRPRSPISTVMSLTHIPTNRSATPGSIPRAKLIAYSSACGRWASECFTVSRTRRVRRAIISGPRSRRTALPPSGRGRPVSSFHHAPRSSSLTQALPAVGQLSLVDDEAHVGAALAHLVEDPVEGHDARRDARREQLQREVGRGQRARAPRP